MIHTISPPLSTPVAFGNKSDRKRAGKEADNYRGLAREKRRQAHTATPKRARALREAAERDERIAKAVDEEGTLGRRVRRALSDELFG